MNDLASEAEILRNQIEKLVKERQELRKMMNRYLIHDVEEYYILLIGEIELWNWLNETGSTGNIGCDVLYAGKNGLILSDGARFITQISTYDAEKEKIKALSAKWAASTNVDEQIMIDLLIQDCKLWLEDGE